MNYSVVLKEEANDDLKRLSKAQKILIFKQLKKLETSPELGSDLGNKAGYNLHGYKKIYADKKRLRIVYQIINDQVVVEVIAIGKRDDMDVYRRASERI
jgi:mRNA interferase RelE/StbE